MGVSVASRDLALESLVAANLEEGMAKKRHEHGEVLAHGLGAPRQIDDEGAAPNARGGAGEGGERLDLDGLAQK